MVAVETGRVPRGSVLIVEAIDRLTREHLLDAFDMISSIIRGGVEIHTIEDGAIYSWESLDNGESRRLAEKIDSARFFSQRLSRRLISAWTEKRTASAKPLTKMCPAWLRVEGGEYKIIEERAAIVRRIFEQTASGIGRIALAKRLNQNNVPPFSQREQGINRKDAKLTMWHASYIQKIVENRAVLGFYQPHEKRTANNKKRVAVGDERLLYPQVVSFELWERAQTARAGRIKRGGRRGKQYRNILSGFCYCGTCDGKMTYRNKGARHPHLDKSDYLMCDTAIRGGACDNKKYYQYDRVEKAVLDTVIGWHTYDASLFESSNNEENLIFAELGRLKQQIEKIQRHIDNILSSLDGEESKAALRKVKQLEDAATLNETNISHLNNRLDVLKQNSSTDRFTVVSNVRNKAETENEGKYEARALLHQALCSIVEYIVFDPQDYSAFVVLKGWLMNFTITKNGETTDIAFHNNGESIWLVGDGFTDRQPSPDFVIEWQQQKPDDVKKIRRNMTGITYDQTQRAASKAISQYVRQPKVSAV